MSAHLSDLYQRLIGGQHENAAVRAELAAVRVAIRPLLEVVEGFHGETPSDEQFVGQRRIIWPALVELRRTHLGGRELAA